MLKYIFQEKFKTLSPQEHFKKFAGPAIEIIFDYILNNLSGNVVDGPTKDSPWEEKVIEALSFVDDSFGSKLFRKIEPFTEENLIAQKAASPLPSVQFSGRVH